MRVFSKPSFVPGDRGETEHTRWNPNCAFLRGRDVGNVALGQERHLSNHVVRDRALTAPMVQEGMYTGGAHVGLPTGKLE